MFFSHIWAGKFTFLPLALGGVLSFSILMVAAQPDDGPSIKEAGFHLAALKKVTLIKGRRISNEKAQRFAFPPGNDWVDFAPDNNVTLDLYFEIPDDVELPEVRVFLRARAADDQNKCALVTFLRDQPEEEIDLAAFRLTEKVEDIYLKELKKIGAARRLDLSELARTEPHLIRLRLICGPGAEHPMIRIGSVAFLYQSRSPNGQEALPDSSMRFLEHLKPWKRGF
jgi:hypothetical protein